MKMKTQILYLFNRLLCSPLEAMFTLLIFIIGKDGGASPLQLTVLATAKPIVNLFAFYLSALITNNPRKIKQSLIVINLLGCLPCFVFPFIQNPWFYVLCFVLFKTTYRASFPSWSEILKSNLGLEKMSRSVSKGTSINYATLLSLPLLFSFWMDQNPHTWKLIFLSLALLQIANTLVILLLPISFDVFSEKSPKKATDFITPLKEARRVFKESPSFAKYLLMYVVGGVGIVITQPFLPIYFKEVLELSYKQLTLAFSFCKGVSFVLSSPLWARYANRISLYLLNGFMDLFTCLFFVCIFASSFHQGWLYLGYIFYGIMQAGCELSWNLSGPQFSQNKDSTLYSSLNLITVGLRGCICPFLGQLLFFYSGLFGVLSAAFLSCLFALFYALYLNRAYNLQTVVKEGS